MVKGDFLGKGMTAEVYEWGNDKILKLFFERFSDEWINYEIKIGKAVNNAGVPSPAVYNLVEVDKRKGIVFQRIFGKTMLKNVQEEPWKIYYYAQQLADLQYKIHQYSSVELPLQKDRFTAKIKESSIILGKKVKKILEYVDGLPVGNSICHGDFHFNNIIVSNNGLIPIDWTNAYLGSPLGDIARTYLMMTSPTKPAVPTDYMLMPQLYYTKWLTYWTYLNEYVRLSKIKSDSIDDWILPAAAVKLRDKIPDEEKWLLDIINRRLEKLG